MVLTSMDLDLLDSDASLRSTLIAHVRKDPKYAPTERDLDPDWANNYCVGLPCATTVGDWKRYFAEHQFYIKSTDSPEQLGVRAKRCAKGLPSYGGHSVKTLRLLARDRGLTARLERKANKEHLVNLLEAADDERDASEASREFPKFFKLPPELKNRVYAFYFQSLGRVPPRFVLPPLCRTSRQLRRESTGLFFEYSIFILWLRPEFTLSPGREQARLQYHTEIAKLSIATANFARIKHLCVELRSPLHQLLLRTWDINLINGQCVANYTKKKARVVGEEGRHVQKLVDSIMTRDGCAKLSKSDLSAFEMAVSKEYWTSGAWS